MTDNDDRMPLTGHIFQQNDQILRFLRGQHRRRFIQDQQIGPTVQSFDDFHALLFTNTQLPDIRSRVHRHAIRRADFHDFLGNRFQIENCPFCRGHSQRHIFADCQRRHQHEMLMHHPDSFIDGRPGRVDSDRLAIDENTPFIRLVQSVQDIHQRRFAGAVFAQ